ncbi:MAG TPA: LptF/LptG family permease, partial [bacterium]|nr:LptF/LptG family permease [bacterium]
MPFRRRRSVEIPPLAAPEEAPPAPGEGEMESSPSPLPGARGRRRRWSPISLVDRYLASEILMVTAFCILGFAILIVGNNFYNAHDLIFKKGLDIPITMLAWLAVLDAPASMVLSLPIATTFGVMLAVGRMGRDSELIAMRAGGASLGRILRPILFVGLLLSIFNYYAGEFWVPQVGNQAATLRRQHLSRESEHRHRDQFFRDNEGRIIYTAQYDDRTKVLEQPFVMQIDEQGPGVEDDLLHFWRSGSQGKFEEDELVLTEMGSVKHHVCAWNPALEGWELWYKEELTAPEQVRLPFPAELQAIAAEQENARYLSAR